MLSASAAFAISDDATLSEVSDKVTFEENVLSVADDSITIESNDDSNVYTVGADNIVTNDTFFDFFNGDGTLLDNVTVNELIFEGDFSGVSVDQVLINKPIIFTGDNAVFDGVTFAIYSDNVTIDGFNIIQNDVVTVYISGSNVVLSNNIINTSAVADETCFGIHAFEIKNLQIINNTISYVGSTDGTVFNNALRIEGDDDEDDPVPATNIVVSGNTFDIVMPSVDVGYDPDTWASTVMNDAILFYYCEDLMFVDNEVKVKYNDVPSASGWDSLYAVSVRSDAYTFGEIQSSGVVIADNTIDIEGYSCVYPVYVCADDFEVTGNDITSTSETYLAHGIDVDGPSAGGLVAENDIVAEAPLAAYGIYSYQYMGEIGDIVYSDNTIDVTAYASAGMEIVECNPEITGNVITADGNYTYGIIASIRDDGIISDNQIDVFGSNDGTDPSGDGLMPKNSMGISVKGDALIEGNGVGSTNIGINLVEDGDITVTGNNIDVEANALIDSYGIYSHGLSNLTVTDNELRFLGNTDGTVVNNGVRIEGDDDGNNPVPATNIVVSGNTFDLEIPSVDVGYDPDTWASTVMNDGIVFYYCEDLEFTDNSVTLGYNDVYTAYGWDSLYAVSVRSDAYTFGEIQSKDVVIADNTIDIEGHSCVYPVYVCADDFEVTGNNITSTSKTYLAHGIDVDGPSAGGLVAGNVIDAEAPTAAYGIYSYQYMGAIENITYDKNTIDVTAYASAGMEIVECNPEIIGNGIVAKGNYTYGIIASIRDKGVISDNVAFVLGSNIGEDATGDGLMPKNSMGISVKGDALIDGNGVGSTNIGINLVEDGDITVTGNDIDVEANALIDSYGIYSHGLSNLTVTDNELRFLGNTDGTVVNNGVRIEGDDDEDNPVPATNIVVSGNTFDLEIPSVDVGYDPDTWASTVMNDGIVFYYCEDLEFAENNVKVKYNDVYTAYGWDSLYAVSVRSDAYTFGEIQSKDVVIADNTIDIEGYSCVYPVYVCADDFEVTGNNITSTSETYLAHGIDVDGPSAVGLVAKNDIVAKAPTAAYGIYSYQYMGAIEDIVYSGNTIDVVAYASAGMEIVECNPEITGNVITADGNYTYGIIASIRDDGNISDNKVYLLGSNIGEDATGDGLMTKNSMGISVKGYCLIANNYIGSTDIGINLVEDGEIVVDNNSIDVISNTEDIDNHAIVANEIDSLVISNNEICYIGATTPKDDYKTAKAYAVYVVDSAVVMENNTLEISVPSIPADWEEVSPGSGNYVRHAYTEGIVFDGCDDSSLSNNDILMSYDGGHDGSIYVVDVIDSDNFLIEGNTIKGEGESYLYCIIMEGENFNITGNEIYATSEYYANGIDIEGTSNGVIDSNEISATGEVAYPIYGGMSRPVSCDIAGNEIIGEGYFVVGIELSGEDIFVYDNIINVEGNHTIAIGVNADSLLVNNNTITSEASNTGNISIWDSIGTDTTGIKSKKGTVEITENKIFTTGEYSVDIGDCEGTVNSNYLISDLQIGDKSVSFSGPASVYENYPILKVILRADDLDKVYDDGQLFVVSVVDENGHPLVNVTLVALTDLGVFRANTSESGVAEFDIELPEGIYDVTTVYSGSWIYPFRTIDNTISVTAKETKFVADANMTASVIDVAEGNVYFNLTLVDIEGKALDNKTIKITFANQTNEFTTEKGMVSYNLPKVSAGNYTIEMVFASDGCYSESNLTASVEIYYDESSVSAEDVTVSYGDEIIVHVVSSGAVNVTYQVIKDGVDVASGTVGAGEDITDLVLAAGSYTVNLTTGPDENHTSSSNVSSITVNPVESSVSAEDVNVSYGDEIIVHVVSSGAVNVTYQVIKDGIDVTGGIIMAGEDITGLVLDAGSYTVNLTTGPDENHTSVSNVSSITIDKAKSSVSAEDVTVTYGEDINIEVTSEHAVDVNYQVIDESGMEVANGTVEPVVLSRLRASVSSKGVISGLKLSAGKYTVNLTTVPEDNYDSANYVSSLEVNIANSSVKGENIEVYVGDPIVIKVTSENATSISYQIIDEKGDAIVNGTINPGEDITVSDLPAGTYAVNLTAITDENHSSSTSSSTIVVNKIPSSVVPTANDIHVGEKETIDIYVGADDASGSVNVTVNGEPYNDISVVDGVAQVIVSGLPEGNYTVDVAYSGDDKYLASEGSTSFKVEKDVPPISIDNQIVVDDKITISLPEDATGNVTIEVDGKTYVQQVSNGKAVFDLSDLKVGSYEIKIYYSGDEKYDSINTTATIKVVQSENNSQENKIEHFETGLSVYETANPIMALFLVLIALGFSQLRRLRK